MEKINNETIEQRFEREAKEELENKLGALKKQKEEEYYDNIVANMWLR
ncbi:MAG: hypothetical protein FWD56_00425 [Bacteroidales bacterium]|nr:hypothetical protein [Bacteroidales bacterium]